MVLLWNSVYFKFVFRGTLNFGIKNMSGQAKISSFFSSVTPSNKRSAATDENTPIKKQKTEEHGTVSPSNENGREQVAPLSPEQRERIEENKRKALAKLGEKVSDNVGGILVNVGTSWKKALSAEFSKPYFQQLSKFVEMERSKATVYPPSNQVFSWTQLCKLESVKVVILGQDPYHGPNQAHGLCFSVRKGVPPPPSLVNMYKELEKDIEGFKHPGHGTLIGWAEQGVLLLNACLTVRAHQANSHKDKGWEKFTDAVISWINKNMSSVVFILWGSYAQKKGSCIDKKKHLVLKGVHPSPLSAHRGFFGCKHFSKCNEYLKQQGKKPVDWNHLPPQE